MLDTADLWTLLKGRLLQGTKIRLYYISTAAASCPALFAAGPGEPDVATTTESHFLIISQPCSQSTERQDSTSDVVVLGVEVLIFTTNDQTTIFVSKADSTGLLIRHAIPASRRTSLAQIAITAFLEFLTSRRLDRNRVVLSLFARSQNQYLFPGSIENVTKHVLQDRQLIKWWCRILDALARKVANSGLQHVNAHVVVPGCDIGETKAFFPPSTLSSYTLQPLWRDGYPVDLLTDNTSLPVRSLIPRLPDDPKSRFLDDLDAQRDADGSWRGVKTLDQFWELMSHRQECSAGKLVGFVWVVFSPATVVPPKPRSEVALTMPVKLDEHGVKSEKMAMQKAEREQREQDLAPKVMNHQASSVTTFPLVNEADDVMTHEVFPSSVASSDHRQKSPALTALTILNEKDPLLQNSVVENPTIQPPVKKDALEKLFTSTDTVDTCPTRPLGGIVVSTENYQILMDEMLHLDFAGEETAIESTTKWRTRLIELSGNNEVGIEIEGIAASDSKSAAATASSEVESKSTQSVNILTGLRKKRKVEPDSTVLDSQAEESTAVNNLATTLVRKKPKA